MFALLLKLPQEVRERHDLSSLRFVMHGAAPCSPHLKKAMIDWWGPVIFEHYGGTETGALTFCGPEDWLSNTGTGGRVLDDAYLTVLDAAGVPCPPGVAGPAYGRRAHFPDLPERARGVVGKGRSVLGGEGGR